MREGDGEGDKLCCTVFVIGEGLPVVVCVPKEGVTTCVNVPIEGLALTVFDCRPLVDPVTDLVEELEGETPVVTVVDESIEDDPCGEEESVA